MVFAAVYLPEQAKIELQVLFCDDLQRFNYSLKGSEGFLVTCIPYLEIVKVLKSKKKGNITLFAERVINYMAYSLIQKVITHDLQI